MKRSIRTALAVLSLLFLAFIVVAPILAHANPQETRPMMTQTRPLFITQYIGAADSAPIEQVASALLAELAKLAPDERPTATMTGLSGIRMGYTHTLSHDEELSQRQHEAVVGLTAIKSLPPSEVPAAIDRLLLELQRTEL